MSKITPLDHIIISGAREHNLKDISLNIPKNKLVVFTGLSGSGKSSLAFDTLYAEGQRRYVESLSSYARQFLGIMSKPDVDQIEGLSPAISIDQKTTSHNPRSTVGTITEIYDYLRLLFARVGHPHCPNCKKEISNQSIDQIIGHVFTELEARSTSTPSRVMILAPVVRNRKGEFSGLFETLKKKGYSRIRIDGSFYDLDDDVTLIKTNSHSIEVVIDRLVISKTQLKNKPERKTITSRLTQSIEESLNLAEGLVIASWITDNSLSFPDKPTQFEDRLFSEKLACSDCGISFKELEPRMFSFNSPEGACETCTGLGSIMKIDPEKIIAPILSISEGAIIPFARVMGKDSWWSRQVVQVVEEAGFDFRKTAFQDMSPQLQEILLHGHKKVYEISKENRFGKMTTIHRPFEGFITNLERRYQETSSEWSRKEIEMYMQREVCPSCNGDRLKDEMLSVVIDQKNIAQITKMTIIKSHEWIQGLKSKNTSLSPKEQIISQSILKEVELRLKFLISVGLNYLTLSREAATLAGGEAQRIRLASQIGTGLTGVLYILDEPTIGLHPRDNQRLIETLTKLRDQGNSVIVVEHDRDIMLASDHIVDFGPNAGQHGGEVVFEGTAQQIQTSQKSLTGKYLSRKKDVVIQNGKKTERILVDPDDVLPQSVGGAISLRGASYFNLKHIDVDFPLRKMVCITGISGSGKSTLLHETLYNNLAKKLGKKIDDKAGTIDQIIIPDEVQRVSLIDQSPIGRTPRSNPATYTKLFDYVRKVFANTKDAHMRGYKLGRFSFNVKGGRCEACQGGGQIKIEMQFLPDIHVDCDVCHGERYNQETLQVKYKGKSISEVLDLSVEEAFTFFSAHSTIREKLQTLLDVGLGYLKLGQPAPTLSGGEAQRVKLAKELSGRTNNHVVYLLDEPTTGLHFGDVQKLLNVLHQLVAQNNTVIIIEHNLDIVKNCDWIIDLGPEGGEYGGDIVATGTPQAIANNPDSITGEYLKRELESLQ